ncbi:MAG: 1,4-dihydroxy-2-naphthoate polyprenyltransferase [Plesiomonas sp.]|uniref:1,4-dihydroxy-2-naphthoate polyprenyltransferase n=1 Tax=Plesiomonas sp. TaxID=2486279 RepID=UPI003EE5F5A9
MSDSKFAIWLEATRPRTLPLALASIVTGAAVAMWQGRFQATITVLALLTATLLQILSNLANDYGDAVKGTDKDRVGPRRAVQSGLISAQSMKRAMLITLLFTLVSGGTLILLACRKPEDIVGFLLMGVVAIIAAITYTVGNKPYGYMGLGDISVLTFFGLLGVCGTYYLQTGTFEAALLLPALGCGLLATAVLNLNNLRDIETDRICGKNTLAVRMGPLWGRRYHLMLIGGALLSLALYALFTVQTRVIWLFLLASPLLIKHAIAVWHEPNGAALRPLLEQVVKGALLTNILFAIGLVLS